MKYAIKLGDEYLRKHHGSDCFTDDLGHAIIFDDLITANIAIRRNSGERIVEIVEDEEGGIYEEGSHE